MSYFTFFKSLNKLDNFKLPQELEDSNILNLNPIIIFKGLHLGNIIYLFKINGYTVNGGSITLRHKLSMTEYRLAKFLYLTDLFENIIFIIIIIR